MFFVLLNDRLAQINFLIVEFFLTFFGKSISLIVLIEDITIQIQFRDARTHVSTACGMCIIMFYTTPKSSFQLWKFYQFVLIVLFVYSDDIEDYIVVLIQ